jgi:Na+-transporting NADH:ubiquinone oxidoreductase subunit A
MIKVKKGLSLPITGEPNLVIHDGPNVSTVALNADDLMGMKPTMVVQVGDNVKTGQLLFTDKKTEGVNYTSPASGEVIAINRGAKRAFQSIVIKVVGDEHTTFSSHKGSEVSAYSEEEAKALLLESGMWPSLRRRPFSKVANPIERASSIFVTAIDTHPLAFDPSLVVSENAAAFKAGLEVLSKLTDKVFLCTAPGSSISADGVAKVEKQEFSGPHPAGLVGTHIHFLSPVGEKHFVWHTPYQEVIAIGKLFETGKLHTERVISLAGPAAKNPRLVKTRMGACLRELCNEEKVDDQETRIISGSVFGGRAATDGLCYLGRFHNQISLLHEGRKRELLGWHTPGFDMFSVQNIYVSKLLPRKMNFTTTSNGSLRSIVPIGSYEKVMPLDILPTFLLRALMSGNTDRCVDLGALELDEEDLSLVTFVDPCKNNFGIKLRENLTKIEKEG